MSSKEYASRLGHAITATGFAEPVSLTFKPDQVTVIFRLAQGSEPKWVDLAKKILEAERSSSEQAHAWKTDISKAYFLKGEKLVYGWRISVQTGQMSISLDYLIRAMKGDAQPKPTKGEETEMTFTGFEGISDRNVPKPGSKKGAYKGETVPIDRR
jgi:hypothetical protein